MYDDYPSGLENVEYFSSSSSEPNSSSEETNNIAQSQSASLIPEYNKTVSLEILADKTLHRYTIKNKTEIQPDNYSTALDVKIEEDAVPVYFEGHHANHRAGAGFGLIFLAATLASTFTEGQIPQDNIQEDNYKIHNVITAPAVMEKPKTFYAFGAKPEKKTSDPPLKTTSDYMVTIDGTVLGSEYSNLLPGTEVSVKDDVGNLLAEDIANASGEYSVTYLQTGMNEQVSGTNKDGVYPNPYKNETNLEINVPNPNNYVLSVISVDGKLIYAQNILLPEGNNKLNLEGGSKGFHLITLTDGENEYSYKAIQTQNTGMPFFAEVESTGPLLKTTSLTTDSVYVQFIKPGYDTLDVKLASETQTYNAIMQQLKDTINFTLKPFLETGLSVTTINPTFYVSIDWEDGTTTTHTGDVMNITKALYKHPDGSFGTALIYNDTTDLDEDGYWVQNWSLGRRPNQVTNIPNWYQNESSLLIPEFKTTMTLDSLDGQIIHHYTIKNKAETQENVFEDLDSEFTRFFIISTGDGASSMNIDLNPYNIADSLDLFFEGFNESTNEPMPQWQRDRVTTIADSLLETKYHPNGDILLIPHRFYIIESTTDPRYQALVNRNFENSIKLAFYDEAPGNGRTWSSTYTYNEHLRLKYTYAKFNPNSPNGTILAEFVSALTGGVELTGGLAPYVSTIDGFPTEYCKSISAIPVLFNLGTGDSKSGNAQPKLNDYEMLRSLTVHNPDGTTTQINDIISTYDFFKEVQETLDLKPEYSNKTE